MVPRRATGIEVERAPRPGAASLLLALCSGCGPAAPPPARAFELEQVSPRDRELFLNHPLVFRFSEPVEPTSLTSESLRIATADGRPARGVFRVEGSQVQFLPDPGLSPRLDDGGFLPGERYDVRVRGFPLPDGVRSADGLPLRCSYTWSFATAARSDSPRDMFRDRTLGYAEPLRVTGGLLVGGQMELALAPYGPIVLECSEPLDPASITAEDFTLRRLGTGGGPVSFELALVENHDAGDLYPRGRARLELRPREPLEEGLYLLDFAEDPRLTDLGGNTPPWPRGIELRVLSALGEHVERFLDAQLRSSLAVSDADGTARWGDDGVVSIRFPRAAGDGGDGEVVLGEREERKDVQATHLSLPAGERCELSAPGLVVLRSQGRMSIAGELRRGGGPGPSVGWERGERLSRWLEQARAEDPAWTVLVAGGDLVVEGEIHTEGPLILVAGGWIRVSGQVRHQAGQLWKLGEGGGLLLDPPPSSLDLELDSPEHNPLRTELRFAVLSVPVPTQGRVGSWLGAEAFGRAHSGDWSVRYVPATGELERAVLDPRELDPPTQVRLLVELAIGPPDLRRNDWLWRPPVVDEVRLRWEWEPAGRED